ncbi:hypothetical protein pb186bvf_012789 [Paramecium bursaria]
MKQLPIPIHQLKTEDDNNSQDKSNRNMKVPSKMTTSRQIQIPKKTAHFELNTKDNWQKMFGNFLHDISLKKKKSEANIMNSQYLQDPLVTDVPIYMPLRSKDFKIKFYKYLDGDLDIMQMMEQLNFPHRSQVQVLASQEYKQISEDKKKVKGIISRIQKFRESIMKKDQTSPTPIKLNPTDETPVRNVKQQQILLIKQRRIAEAAKIHTLKQSVQRKTKLLREFIQTRIDIRKQENHLQREEDIRNIHFIKTFFDITQDYKQQIQNQQEQLKLDDFQHYKKQIPGQRKLKQMLINFENVQPIIKHHTEIQSTSDLLSKQALKQTMLQNSKDYLYELEYAKKEEYKNALQQIKKFLEMQNIRIFSESRKTLEKSESYKQQRTQNRLDLPGDDEITDRSPKLPPQASTIRDLIKSQFQKRNRTDGSQHSIKMKREKSISKSKFENATKKQLSLDVDQQLKQEVPKKPFYLFQKKAKSDKNPKNTRGLITHWDLRLYDYIHNKRIYTSNPNVDEASKRFHKMIEDDQEVSNQKKLDYMLLKRRMTAEKGKRQNIKQSSQFERVKSDPNHYESVSDDQSLQSVYEVNLDSLYNQSNELAQKLNERNTKGFAKRLKQLMRLEDVNKACVRINLQKLKKEDN